MKIFLSYARDDEASATRLYRDLTSLGYDVWFDRVALLPGHQWKIEIKRAIRSCGLFICLLSTHSVNKRGYVQKEIRDALDVLDETPEANIFVIPAKLEPCPVPFNRLEDLQWLELFPDWNAGLGRLAKAIDSQGPFAQPSSPSQTLVTISQPSEGERVPHAARMEGRVANLPSGMQMWSVSVQHPGIYHPNRGQAIVVGNRWFATAYVGYAMQGASQGDAFTIHLVMVSASEADALNKFVDQCHLNNSWPGLGALPGTPLAEVRVVRDDS